MHSGVALAAVGKVGTGEVLQCARIRPWQDQAVPPCSLGCCCFPPGSDTFLRRACLQTLVFLILESDKM